MSNTILEARAQFKAQLSQYIAKQNPIVRGLHPILQIWALICVVLAIYFFVAALYNTYLWATTGNVATLTKWANFGFSMSFLVFPCGLDSMLLRAFPPTVTILPPAWIRSSKPLTFSTGMGAFFAGFGVMSAGAPGAVVIINSLSQAVQKLF